MKKNLEEQIAQLFPQLLRVLTIQSLEHFVSLLEEVGLYRVVCLFPVPRAAVRRTEAREDADELIKGGRHLDQLTVG
jgi:hypothetical protein